MNWSELVERIELKPRFVLPVFALASVLLLAPSGFLGTLGLESAATESRLWIGLVWVVSGSLLIRHALLPIFVAASVLLFAPSGFLGTLGLEGIAAEYRFWIGVAWIVSGSPLLSRAVVALSEPVRDWLEKRREEKKLADVRKERAPSRERRSGDQVVPSFQDRRRRRDDRDEFPEAASPEKAAKYQEA